MKAAAPNHDDVRRAMAAMAALYSKTLTVDAVEMLLGDLGVYPPVQILASLSRCRQELRSFPSVAEIISRLPERAGGHPGAEEAWAMIPLTEGQSVVWTEEMADAYGVAQPLLDRDEIAARMAFKERYTALLGQARAEQRPPKWTASLGHDQTQREICLREAVRKGRITEGHAQELLPHYEANKTTRPMITGKTTETDLTSVQNHIAEILAKIQRGQS